MTISVQNTNVTNTFDYWRNRTNELANYMSTAVITTDANGATTNTSGNATITGTFTANSFQVSNSQGTYTLQGSVTGSYTTNSLMVGSNVIIDYVPFNNFSSAEYIVKVTDNTANNYYSSKTLVTHDFGTSYSTEYAILITNNVVGSFATSTNATHVIFNYAPTSTNTTVKYYRLSF